MEYVAANLDTIVPLTINHIWLSLLPLILGIIISIPLGKLASSHKKLGSFILSTSAVLYTIPSLVIFIVLPSIIGTSILDPINVVIALTLYTVSLLVRSVVDALSSIPYDVEEAAIAVGYSQVGKFYHVELPLCLPVFIAGIRVASVSNISLISVASLIGIDNLGTLFTNGFRTYNVDAIIVGIVLTLVLAFALDTIIRFIGKILTPWIFQNNTALKSNMQKGLKCLVHEENSERNEDNLVKAGDNYEQY